MKSKKWLISLGLAVVLVVAFALPACEATPTEYWHTPEGEKISFEVTTYGGTYGDMGLMITSDLQDLGLDVTHRVLDSTTFLGYLYQPNLGGMQVCIFGEDTGLDPWSDWIWFLMADPEGWGYMWNPTWWSDERFEELYLANYLADNLTEKQEILFEMQEIVAEDLPMTYLVRPDFISAHRTDNWENWYNTMGGPVSWLNEWNIREVTPVDDATRYNIGSPEMMDTMNMEPEYLFYTDIGCLYTTIVYETLAFYPKIDEDPGAAYDFVPKLAANYSWSYEGTNQTLTIDLREGVKWHDYETSGRNFTADDVVYSMKYVHSKWDFTKPIDWDAVEADTGWLEIWPEHVLIEADGDYTVKLTYIDGYHQPEDYAPTWFLWDPIVPKHIFEPDEREPWEWDGNSIGTGPFKVKEFETEDYLLLERFDDYWGPLPEAQEVMFKLFTGAGSMWLALEAGNIDTHDQTPIPHTKIATYETNPGLAVEFQKGITVYYLAFNLHPTEGYDPVQDKVLRQAIAYAIDSEDILELVYGGYGELADGWIYRESPMHNPDLPQYEFSLTTARDMLLAANYTFHE